MAKKKKLQKKLSAVQKNVPDPKFDKLKCFLSEHAAIFVAIVSFVINITVLADYQKSPFSKFLLWDSANYWKWALEIAGGNWLGNSIFHQTPLYPYLLSVFISIFGENLLPIYLFQCIVSAATSAAVYSICVKITGNKLCGLIAGLLYSFYGMQVFFTTRILSECISAFLTVLAVRLLISGRFFNFTILSGFFMGILLLVKTNFLLAVPLVLLFYKINFKPDNIPGLLKKSICFLFPLVLVVSVVTIRNYYVSNEFVLVSGNGGENFYIGNNDKANGTYIPIDGISSDIAYQNADVIALAQSNSERKLTRSEVSKYWFRKGIAFITEKPLRYTALEWTKFKNIFSGAELTNMYIMKFEKDNLTHSLHIPFINFYILFPFMLAGLITAFRQWKKYYILLSMLFVNWINIMIFFYDTRFMITTMPLVIILSGSGLWNILMLYSKHKFSKNLLLKPSFIAFILGTGLVLLILHRDSKFPDQDWRILMSLGEIYYGLDNTDRSIEYFVKASELNRENCMPSFGVCKALFKKGNTDIAAGLYMSTFKTIGDDDKKTILRDTDFDHLREYINSKSQNSSEEQ